MISWHFDETGLLTIKIVIPFNASASVVLPDAQVGDVSINDQPLHEGNQIGERVELTLGAGCHRVKYYPKAQS